MKINTLQLMMSATYLPMSDLVERSISACNYCDCNNFLTSLNIHKDVLLMKENWINVFSESDPDILYALDEFSRKALPVCTNNQPNYDEVQKTAINIMSKYNFSKWIEIKGGYSILFAIVLIAQIEDVPGYSYQVVVDYFRRDNPGIPEMLMGTVLGLRSSEKIHLAAFDFRDWWKKQKQNNETENLFCFQAKIKKKVEELRVEYDLPKFIDS